MSKKMVKASYRTHTFQYIMLFTVAVVECNMGHWMEEAIIIGLYLFMRCDPWPVLRHLSRLTFKLWNALSVHFFHLFCHRRERASS